MTSRYSVPEVDYALSRDSAFSYTCNACSRCCHHKVIRVGPYEILRLARRLGITTTRFIADHTEAGGTVLRTREDDDSACIFLGEAGCGVHADRPIACRIYPLGSRVDGEGCESFGLMKPHPETEGIYGESGTVGDFLEQQGLVQDYAVVERYRELFVRMARRLESMDQDGLSKWSERQGAIENVDAGLAASPWIDIDKTVAEFCQARERALPNDIDGAIDAHIEAIDAWIASMEE